MGSTQSDAMIARLEGELEERNAFIQGTIASAEDAGRDLSDNETELIKGAKARIDSLRSQLETLHDTRQVTMEARQRASQVQSELTRMRREADSGPVEYRSAGAYALDMYQSHLGDREARERLEAFHRAAAHQKTPDNLGVIPDPVVGDVVNFIDAARPIVNALGPRPLPGATWHRPVVTQHTAVGPQGSAGAAADQKTELVSQKMLISRLTANAVTYGGYVNVARQNIDFSSPQIMDIIINDLAAQYAIETEGAVAAALAATGTTAVTYDLTPATGSAADSIASALWTAAGTAYSVTKGQGRLVLAVAPDVLGDFGPLFAPVNPQNAQSSGFSAGSFGQGALGTISGIQVVMSSGLAAGEAFVFSTAAIEAYEQRVGTLQVTEPSVLGVQVAYAGYFTPLTINDDAIIPLEAAA